MKILQICPRVPFPPHDGGAIAMYDVVCNLNAAGHEVTVLAINTPKHFQPDDVLAHVAELITVPVNTNISVPKAFLNLFNKLPYNVERFISPDVEAKLVSLLQTRRFDVIQMEGTFVAWYIDLIKKHTDTPVVLRSHNLEYLIWERLALNEKNLLKKLYLKYLASGLKRFEAEYCNRFDAIAAITEQDKKRLEQLGCKVPVHFIPAGVELSRFRKNDAIAPKPKSMFILSALNWLPNLEGIDWFLDNVWQVVGKEMPELELHIAGKSAPDSLLNLNMHHVHVHGFVPSAADFMQSYDLMLVPLLSGSGMRIKIIEGMAMGKCILSTSVGAEGIFCKNGENIIICDDPDVWIQKIRLFYEGNLGQKQIGEKAHELACTIYDNKMIVQKFQDLYRSLQ